MRTSLFILLSAFLLPLGALAQEEHAPVLGLNLDLTGRGAYAGNGGPSLAGGAGLKAFGDVRPLDFLSIGTGFDFAEYPGNGSWQVLTWNLGVRIFPLSGMEQNKGTEWYLQGEAGLNLTGSTLEKHWPGTGLVELGMGFRSFVLGPGQALDFGAFYDFYTPFANPLQAVGIKAGMTWLFGQEAVSTPTPTATPTAVKTTSIKPTPALTPKAAKKPVKIDYKKPRHRIHKDDLGDGEEIPLPAATPSSSDSQ